MRRARLFRGLPNADLELDDRPDCPVWAVPTNRDRPFAIRGGRRKALLAARCDRPAHGRGHRSAARNRQRIAGYPRRDDLRVVHASSERWLPSRPSLFSGGLASDAASEITGYETVPLPGFLPLYPSADSRVF